MGNGRDLGVLKPARFAPIAAQERQVYDATLAIFGGFVDYVWPFVCPGIIQSDLGAQDDVVTLALPDAYQLTPAAEVEFDKAVAWFIDSMMGKARDPEAFSDPSNAAIDVHSPIYNGQPILPGQLRTGYQVGIARAVQTVGDDAPRLLGIRNYMAQQEFLRNSFARLSDGARVTIGDVLNGKPKSGQSVKDTLLQSMNEGENPLATARALKKQFADIEGYNWARLARTETGIAQNDGMTGEYLTRGYSIPADGTGAAIALPSFHPNCLCSTTIELATGLIVPDVAATACDVCQSALARANAVIASKYRRR